MAGNTADPFGDYDDDAEYDVSDTEEEDIQDLLDADMSEPDFEDVIPVGRGHYYCLVDSTGLALYYQTKPGSSSSTLGPSHSVIPLRTPTSSPMTLTTQSSASQPQHAPGTTL